MTEAGRDARFGMTVEEALARTQLAHDLAIDLAVTDLPEDVCRVLAHHGRRATGAAGVVVWHLARTGRTVTGAAVGDSLPDPVPAPDLGAAQEMVDRSPRSVAWLTDPVGDALATGRDGERLRLRSATLTAGGRLVGAMALQFGDGPLAPDASLLASIVRPAGEALGRALAREQSTRLAAIVEQASNGVLTLELDGTISDCNSALLRMVGGTAETLIGRRLRDLVRDAGEIDVMLERAQAAEVTLPEPIVKAGGDGRTRQMKVTAFPIRDRDGQPVAIAVSLVDITEAVALTQALNESESREALGRLAAGIAHDLNNMLGVIRGYAQLMAQDLKSGGPVVEDLEEVRRAESHATALVRDLMAFGRSQQLSIEPLHIGPTVCGLERMLRPGLTRRVTLTIEDDSDGAQVLADRKQLERVFVNLALNARDAMKQNGGTLDIRVTPADDSEVRITVADTGSGMTSEVRERIFEPFFTTKPAGDGTGLGLASTRGIIEQLGGRIEVESEPGSGTTFTIVLPRLGAGRAPAPARVSEREPERTLPPGRLRAVGSAGGSGFPTRG